MIEGQERGTQRCAPFSAPSGNRDIWAVVVDKENKRVYCCKWVGLPYEETLILEEKANKRAGSGTKANLNFKGSYSLSLNALLISR